MSCHRCSKTHSAVEAFLLTCCVCNRKWHHRCHAPPVTDSELILRIRAHNAEDSANSLQAWKCIQCTRSGVGSSTPILNPTLPHSSAPPPTIVRAIKNDDDDAVIVVDDSDSDSNHPSSNLTLTGPKRSTHSQSPAIAKPVNSGSAPLIAKGKGAHSHPSSSNDRSAIHPQPTSSSPLFSQHFVQPITTPTDDDEVVVINSFQFPNKETRRNQFRRDAKDRERNKRMEHKQRQQQLLRVKIEAKQAEALASNLDTNSQEPIPGPQTPEVAGSVGHPSVVPETFVGLSSEKTPEGVSQQEVNLAPQWFHDDTNDIWARALRSKTSIPPSRRKIQGRRLNEARPQIFNFDIKQWENHMRI